MTLTVDHLYFLRDLVDAHRRTLGGPGSGHHGHSGRKGGGSTSSGLLLDESNRPLVAYHGTSNAFTDFESGHGGDTLTTTTGAKNGVLGTFFTTDAYKAEELYAGARGRVVEANLELRNPEKLRGKEYDSDASAAINLAAAEYHSKSYIDLTEDDFREWRDHLIRKGKDGIEVTLYPFQGKSQRDFVVFEPTQIKALGGPGSGHHGHSGRKGGGSTSSGPPSWWSDKSTSRLDGGMTRGEVIVDWLTRNKVPKVGDKYRMYHATPKGNAFTELKVGSYLAQDPETAIQQAGRDRGLKAGKIQVHEVLFYPWEVSPTSVWAITTVPITLEPTTLGGPGSGNFGHAGRPGQVGGSASSYSFSHMQLTDDEDEYVHAPGLYISPKYGPSEDFQKTWRGPKAADDVRVGLPFSSQVDQYPEKGKPGVDYFKGEIDDERYVDALLYRDPKGKVVGILNHYPMDFTTDGPMGMTMLLESKGNINIMVDPTARGQGVATALLTEAGRRWPINLYTQDYSAEGRKFVTQFLKKNTVRNEMRSRPSTFKGKGRLKIGGGPGSGNFGHAGRPGKVGGSAAKFGLSIHHTSALQTPVRLYHNSPDLFVEGKPAFDAYYGDENFLKDYPNEFGSHTYAMDLPAGTRVLDLSKDDKEAREFFVKMAKIEWPIDKEAVDILRRGEGEHDDVYGLWTDKRLVRQALDLTPGYDVVKYGAEWVIPKEILSKLSGEKIKTAAAMLRALSRVDALEVDIMLPWPDWSEAEWESRLADAREVAVRRALGGPGSGNFGHAGRPGSVGGSAPSGGLRIIGRQDDVLKIQHSMAQVLDVVRKLSETRTVEVVPKRSMEDRMREYMAKHYQMTDAEFDAQFPKGKKPNGLVDRTRDHVLTTDPETFINQQLRHTMPRLEKSFARLKREGLLKGVDPFTMFSYPSPVIDIMEWSNPLVGIINIPPVKEKLHEWGVM